MKQIVFKISCIVVCVSVMLSVFILPVGALSQPVNYQFNSIPPFHSTTTGAFFSGVFISASGDPRYYEIIIDSWDNNSTVYFKVAVTETGHMQLVMFNPNGASVLVQGNCYLYDSVGSSVGTYTISTYPTVSSGSTFSGVKIGSSTFKYGFGSVLTEGSGFYCMPMLGGDYLVPGETFSTNYASGLVSAQNLPFTFTINGEEYDDGSGGGSGDMTETNSLLEKIYNKLCDIFTFLPELKNNGSDEVVSSVNDVKDSIDDIANAEPSNPLDNDGINEFESAVGEVQSTIPDEDLSNMMGNVDMSGRPIEWIYQQLEDFVSGNNKVFSVYMAILSMSFIMFVLNKGSSVRGG